MLLFLLSFTNLRLRSHLSCKETFRPSVGSADSVTECPLPVMKPVDSPTPAPREADGANISLPEGVADSGISGASFKGPGRRRCPRDWACFAVGRVSRRTATAAMPTRDTIRYRRRGIPRRYGIILGAPSPMCFPSVIDLRPCYRLVDHGITRPPNPGAPAALLSERRPSTGSSSAERWLTLSSASAESAKERPKAARKPEPRLESSTPADSRTSVRY